MSVALSSLRYDKSLWKTIIKSNFIHWDILIREKEIWKHFGWLESVRQPMSWPIHLKHQTQCYNYQVTFLLIFIDKNSKQRNFLGLGPTLKISSPTGLIKASENQNIFDLIQDIPIGRASSLTRKNRVVQWEKSKIVNGNKFPFLNHVPNIK